MRHVIKHMQILKFQVLIKEREYLYDQRKKTGPKGSFQLGPIAYWQKFRQAATKFFMCCFNIWYFSINICQYYGTY